MPTLTGKGQRGHRVESTRNGRTACRSDQRLSGSDVRPLIADDSLNGLFRPDRVMAADMTGSLGLEPIADSLFRENVSRTRRVVFQLSTQAGDENSQVVIFSGILRSPDFTQ